MDNVYYKTVKRILIIIFILNISVALAKAVFGWYSNSLSMITDGFHSFFDGTSNIIGIIGISLASRPADKEHPYGHGKFETFASLLIAVLLFLTCFEILESSINKFLNPQTPEITLLSFAVMGITILINIGVSWYEYRQGKKLGSYILVADSMHTRSDIYASFAVIMGFFAIKFGYIIADPLIAIGIAVLIARTGIRIIKDSSKVLLDEAPIDKDILKNIVKSVDGICDVHMIRTRGSPSEIYVDLHIVVKTSYSVDKAHDIGDEVEKKLKKSIPEIADVLVHIEPINSKKSLKNNTT
ncbi:MAG: cation transporter [Euryarchaeota archaeon]|nr:cation transporter [Euryarchaeota archaeon]